MVAGCCRKCCNNPLFPMKIFENFYQQIWHIALPSRFLSLDFEDSMFHNKNVLDSVILIVWGIC